MRYEVYDMNGCSLSKNAWPEECCCEQQVRLLLIFDEEELRYDIQNVAFSQGDIARVMDNYGHDLLGERREHLMHQWIDVCEEGNYDRVRRMMRQAISEVEQKLYKFVYQRMMNNLSIDNQQAQNKEMLIDLKVPYSFSDATAWYLLRLIHEYIIDSVLEDWASITYPEVQARWTVKKEDVAGKIATAKTMAGRSYSVKPSII